MPLQTFSASALLRPYRAVRKMARSVLRRLGFSRAAHLGGYPHACAYFPTVGVSSVGNLKMNLKVVSASRHARRGSCGFFMDRFHLWTPHGRPVGRGVCYVTPRSEPDDAPVATP